MGYFRKSGGQKVKTSINDSVAGFLKDKLSEGTSITLQEIIVNGKRYIEINATGTGTDGATWFAASGSPTEILGKNNDLYLNTSNYDIYKKEVGTWNKKGNIKGATGDNGKNPEFQKSSTHIQYRIVGDSDWIDLVPLSELEGPQGKNIELQKSATHLQWRVVGDASWTNLVLLSDLKGDAGKDGSVWTSGTSAPSGGSDNDFYLKTDESKIYRKISGTWTLVLTISGGGGGSSVWGAITGTITNQTDLNTALGLKVDKISGKGLSTNDYTDGEKTKLSGIATGATANDTDANLKNRANHTGTQSLDTITETETKKILTAEERTKIANIATDIATASAGAVTTAEDYAKTYADSLVASVYKYCGTYDASSNVYPATGGSGSLGAIKRGDTWEITVAGTLGGKAVNQGDRISAKVDSPAQTAANWSSVEGNLGYTPENQDNKTVNIVGNENSTTLYSSIKGMVDWVTLFFVPKTRTINSKALSSDVTLTTADITEGTNQYFTNARAQSACPAETITTIGALTNAATAKTTPVDADMLPLMNTADSNKIYKLSWANLKATLKIYFDSLYVSKVPSIVNATGNVTVAVGNDYVYYNSGTYTATLHTVVGNAGVKHTIVNKGTGVITVATTSSEQINGKTTWVLNQYDALTVIDLEASAWTII